MPYRAITVANEFLRLARDCQPRQVMTSLKLIKLVYIAHGWSLHFMPEDPLLDEPAQAWHYGPVVPTLYRAVRRYGSSPIEDDLHGDFSHLFGEELDEDSRGLIAAVMNAYGNLSAIELSSMTHQPHTPWSEVWNDLGRNAVIPDDLIRRHYNRLAEQRQIGAA